MHKQHHATLDPLQSDQQNTKVKANLAKLAQGMLDKFGKVSSAFRAFDLRTRG